MASRFVHRGKSNRDPRATVTLRLMELNALIDEADAALDGISNDAEHDALYRLREQLAEMSTDPRRRGRS